MCAISKGPQRRARRCRKAVLVQSVVLDSAMSAFLRQHPQFIQVWLLQSLLFVTF